MVLFKSKFKFSFAIIYILLFSVNINIVLAKAPKKIIVPKKIYFANMRVYMCNDIRSRIQKKVDSLRRWKFQEMLDKANLLFPIMEPIMREQNIPNDIKFLAMHESRLVIDCISPTADYGIWAFNDCAIDEVGIKVNGIVDERMHIVYATRAMGKKMNINYKHFNNWIHTILAYNKGRTGVEKFIKKNGKKYIKKSRGRSIFLGSNTPNYLIYVIAHKLAFKNEVGKQRHPTYKLHIHEISECKNFDEVADKFKIPPTLLKEYNKWLKCPKNIIPNDKKYKVIVPLKHNSKQKRLIKNKIKQNNFVYTKKIDSGNQSKSIKSNKADKYPKILQTRDLDGKKITLINGLYGIVAKKGMTISSISKKAGISIKNFIIYNDIKPNHNIIPGQVYYLESKRSKSHCRYHIAQKGDTWWNISQKYGLKKSKLLIKNNRTNEKPKNEFIQVGRVLHLKFIRSKKSPIKYR